MNSIRKRTVWAVALMWAATVIVMFWLTCGAPAQAQTNASDRNGHWMVETSEDAWSEKDHHLISRYVSPLRSKDKRNAKAYLLFGCHDEPIVFFSVVRFGRGSDVWRSAKSP